MTSEQSNRVTVKDCETLTRRLADKTGFDLVFYRSNNLYRVSDTQTGGDLSYIDRGSKPEVYGQLRAMLELLRKMEERKQRHKKLLKGEYN